MVFSFKVSTIFYPACTVHIYRIYIEYMHTIQDLEKRTFIQEDEYSTIKPSKFILCLEIQKYPD